MRVLVTGCAGFIGSSVCRLLTQEGHSVFGIDNVNDAYDPRMKQWRIKKLEQHDGFAWKQLDITDRHAISRLFQERGFDAVINLAARAGVRQSTADPWTYFDTNVVGTLNLLEACRDSAIRRFILASSSSVYGNEAIPFSENAKADRPLSPYAASKRAAETLCHSHYHNYGINTTVLRFFTVFGPAGRPDMSMFRFVRWIAEGDDVVIYGDGLQQRDFTYIDDVAEGVKAAINLDSPYEIINLGSDRPVELRSVISRIEKRVGKKARIVYDPPDPLDIRATRANISKAKSLLNWTPTVPVEEGIDAAVDWYIDNRSWAREVTL